MASGCSGDGQSDRVPDAPPEPEQTIRVVDGDTLDINGERHRFAGIDAPERHQTCIDANGVEWACGSAATEKLEALIGESPVSCRTSDTDRYGRSVSSCSAGGADLGESLVRVGLALNEPRYAPDRSEAEAEARAAGAGMHAGRFIPPWSWRAGARLTELAPSILASDATVFVLALPFRAETSCDLATCTLTIDDSSTTLSAAEILPADREEGPIASHTVADDGTEFAGFGYWLHDSGFVVAAGRAAPVVEILMAVSIAEHFSATNPRPLDGGATWRGFMSAIDANTATVAALSGTATILLEDFDDPSVDVLLDRIHEIATDVARPDMSWSSIPVEAGAFEVDEPDNRLSGRFYGDIHQEVGGVFIRDNITGAFGAKREPY